MKIAFQNVPKYQSVVISKEQVVTTFLQDPSFMLNVAKFKPSLIVAASHVKKSDKYNVTKKVKCMDCSSCFHFLMFCHSAT